MITARHYSLTQACLNEMIPVFGYTVLNTMMVPVTIENKAGFRYICKSPLDVRSADDGCVVLNIEFNGLVPRETVFEVARAVTKIDKVIMHEMNLLLKKVIDKGGMATTFKHSFGLSIQLRNDYAEEDGGIHSDLLGMALFLNNTADTYRQAFPKGTASNVNRRLMWTEDNYDNVLPEDQSNTRENCVSSENRTTVLYNDPNNNFGSLWINSLGKARLLNKVATDEIRPGLYITYRNGNDINELVDGYYSFDQLDDRTLESLGIFKSKDTATKGGNTERCLQAEGEIKNLKQDIAGYKKEIHGLNNRVSVLESTVAKEEAVNLRLVGEITFLKQTSQLKDLTHKLNTETLKAGQKPSFVSVLGEIAKTMGLFVGTGVALHKVLNT